MKSQPLTMSRNQNFKSYGRGKHSNHPGTVVNSSIQFDKLFFANSNKPTAVKSAGTIGKWGMTSFTSLRSSSFTVGSEKSSRFSSLGKKRTQSEPVTEIQSKRPVLTNNGKRDGGSPMVANRKFFKSRNSVEDANQKTYKSSGKERKASKHTRSSDENKKQKASVLEQSKIIVPILEKPTRVSSKKAAATAHAKIVDETVPLHATDSYQKSENHSSPTKDRDHPPIVLRIFKGTSQLMSETGNKTESSDDEKSNPMKPANAKTLNENLEENMIADSELEVQAAPVTTRSLRRRSPEKVAIPLSEPVIPPLVPAAKSSSRRAVERTKSPSPVPAPEPTIAKTRSSRRRSPPVVSKSPSPEPAITTRSLRRRAAPPTTADVIANPEPSPHTSPKRTLRSTKNALPPAPGKIVIRNLHSDNPVILSNDNDVSLPPPIPSPPRKEPKEHRSYSNKHKHRSRNEKHEPAPLVTVPEEKVEDLLANIATAENDAAAEIEPMDTVTTAADSAAETSLDEDRAELLQLLGDDEDVQPQSTSEKEGKKSSQNSGAESQLKIKIKLPKPSVKAEFSEAEVVPPLPADSQDSGIDVKSDMESNSDSISLTETKAARFDSSADDKLDGVASSENEVFSDNACMPSSSVPIAATTSKKGSFFKHRSSNDGNKKRLGMSLYKHKWVDDKDAANNVEDEKNSNSGLKSKTLDSMLDLDLDDDMPLTKFIRQPAAEKFDFDDSPPVTGVKCSKRNKDFYTVVRNVKKAHQIQESGEFQEFNDDVDYILDALQDNNPIGTRCLSAITLATKCTEPAFRMHVRAHGTVTKFFKALHDATKDQSLGLCTATVMFVLSQDRLNMDLDRNSLELMLNLLESDASHTKALEDCGLTDSQLTKTKDRVRQICADIQAQGHAKHLNLDSITVGHLSMETLLSLTSKRAGEWFKEELRELGGLEHIIKTVVECCKHVDDTANAWSVTSLEKIRKVDRCLRVLENVTMLNEENNDYLLEYQNGILIDTLVRMFKVCDYEIPLYPTYSITDKESTGAVLRECLIANIKVLINVTHDYQNKSNGSSIIGSRPGVIESSLHVLLQVPQYIPKEEKFDLMLLTLIMLINLVEHCDSNRKAIIEAKAPCDEESIFETKEQEPAVKALISMFYNYEELARNEEKKTDAILEGENAEKPPTNAPQKVHEDFIEETISQLVQKAGQNMEHTLIAAYVAMLIGYLIIDNEDYEKFVRNHLPEKNFQFMVTVLQKFYSFMTLTASGGTVSNRDMKSIQKVIQKLIESDRRHGFDSQTPQGSSSAENAKSDDKVSESQTASDKVMSAS